MTHHDEYGHHEHPASSPICRVCTSAHDPAHPAARFGICHHCMYKLLIVLFVLMIAVSYIAWFGVF